MASALVNNVGPVAPEGFLDLPLSAASVYSSYGWLTPRISFSRDIDDNDELKGSLDAGEKQPPPPAAASPSMVADDADLGSPGRDAVVDFEFRRLDDPSVTMLPADELFSDGKLVPLQLAPVRAEPDAAAPEVASSAAVARSLEACKLRRRAEAAGSDPYAAFSPKAPRCSSQWRELLGLKKAAQSVGGGAKVEVQRSSSSLSSSPTSSAAPTASARSSAARSLKHFLHRNAKSSASIDASLSLPLLRDSEWESVSISARLSLSSSSSGPDYEDLPRLSLDSDKPSVISISLGRNPPRVRLTPKPHPTVDPSFRPCSLVGDHPTHHSAVAATPGAGASGSVGRSPMRRPTGDSAAIPARGASVDSPRMNSSGKVVFQSLERSSSSPSTFNGGPKVKHRGMERSYSANVVRVTPVLNVPVCSLRGSSKSGSGSFFGFGHLFSSPHKKDGAGGCRLRRAPLGTAAAAAAAAAEMGRL